MKRVDAIRFAIAVIHIEFVPAAYIVVRSVIPTG